MNDKKISTLKPEDINFIQETVRSLVIALPCRDMSSVTYINDIISKKRSLRLNYKKNDHLLKEFSDLLFPLQENDYDIFLLIMLRV